MQYYVTIIFLVSCSLLSSSDIITNTGVSATGLPPECPEQRKGLSYNYNQPGLYYVYDYYLHAGIEFTNVQNSSIIHVQAKCGETVKLPCQHTNRRHHPYWRINNTVYTSLNSQLPNDHFYSHDTLMVENLADKNRTTYQCLFYSRNSQEEVCEYRSRVGLAYFGQLRKVSVISSNKEGLWLRVFCLDTGPHVTYLSSP